MGCEDKSQRAEKLGAACGSLLGVPLSVSKGSLHLLSAPVLRTKICLNCSSACVSRPVGWRSVPEDILQIQSCPSFDEEPNQFVIASLSGLMQRSRMGMAPDWVVSVWIFARVKQQSNDFDTAKLRRQGESQVAVATIGDWEQSAEILNASQSRRYRQIDPGTAPNQRAHRFQLAMQGCRFDGAARIGSAIAKKID